VSVPSSSASPAGPLEKNRTATGIRVCPSCSSHNVRRSHRKGFVERLLLRMILLRPFRCKNCGLRYYGYALSERDRHPQLIEEDDRLPALDPVPPVKTAKRGAVAGLRCSQCGSSNVHRSRRRERWERTSALALLRRFRCHDCNAAVHAFMPRVWLQRALERAGGASEGRK
jgi:transposase-like protein